MNVDRRLLRLLAAARGWFSAAVASGIFAVACAVVQAWSLSRAIGGVFLRHEALSKVFFFLALFAAAAALRYALNWLGAASGARVAESIKRDLRTRLTTKIFALGPEYAAGGRSGELANTLTRGVEALDAYFAQYLPQLCITALAPWVILAVVFKFDWLSAVIMLVTAPLIPFFMMLIGSTAKRMTDRQWQSLSRMSAHFLDVLQGLPALKLLGRAREQADGVAQVSDAYRKATMQVLRVAFLSALALEMLATLSTAVVAVELGLRLLHGRIGFEHALMILILCPEFYGPLRTLGARFHAGMEGVSAAARLHEILDAPEAAQNARETRDRVLDPVSALNRLPSTLLSSSSDSFHPPLTLSFSAVGFSYPGRSVPALSDVSFDLRPGEITALIGQVKAACKTTAPFFTGLMVFCVLATLINIWFYNRPGCEKPS